MLQDLEHFVVLDNLRHSVADLCRNKVSAGADPLKILEAGCGSLSHFDIEDQYQITGIDISQRQLDRNPHLCKRILGDIQTYQFEESSFDVIFCFWVLEHVDAPTLAMESFVKALRQDGILVIGVPNVMSIKGLITKFTPHWLHIFVYRYIFKYELAGIDDNAPFHSTMRLSISPDSVMKFAQAHDLSVIYFNTFEDYRQEELRHKFRLTHQLWDLSKGLLRIATFNQIKADSTSYAVVLKKN